MMSSNAPLADKIRPQKLEEVVGQGHLLDEKGFIARAIKSGSPASIILWGPPGCGKTTIARLYAKGFDANFVQVSAVFSGKGELKTIVEKAAEDLKNGDKTVLFVDEIHRFNKLQQDAFLPYVEDGTIILVGATTENPSFELNKALLSRVQVLTIKALKRDGLVEILKRVEKDYGKLLLDEDGREYLLELAGGDGRYFLGLVETVINSADKGKIIPLNDLAELLQRRSALYDKSGEGHYNLISALHKAVRGSDPDASLYWFYRIINGGEDPLFIARRLIRMAVEDIGLADPNALVQAISSRDAYQMLGSPEGDLALAQAVVYLALAPKSNALYMASKKAQKSAETTGEFDPPDHILNAPTSLMKKIGYGEGYIYDHDTKHGFSGQKYFPLEMCGEHYYIPVERGFEREMTKRMNYFNKLRDKIEKGN